MSGCFMSWLYFQTRHISAEFSCCFFRAEKQYWSAGITLKTVQRVHQCVVKIMFLVQLMKASLSSLNSCCNGVSLSLFAMIDRMQILIPAHLILFSKYLTSF